jgi:hypothetical protein
MKNIAQKLGKDQYGSQKGQIVSWIPKMCINMYFYPGVLCVLQQL